MTIHNHEVLFVVVAFIAGGLLGPIIWTWLKTWSAKEATVLVDKITGHTGPTGT